MITAEELNGLYQTELAALAQEPVNGNPSAISMRHMLAETRRRPPGAWTPEPADLGVVRGLERGFRPPSEPRREDRLAWPAGV